MDKWRVGDKYINLGFRIESRWTDEDVTSYRTLYSKIKEELSTISSDISIEEADENYYAVTVKVV